MSINKEYLHSLLAELEKHDAKLLAVSKTKPVDLIREVIEEGHFRFGENRVKELSAKHEELSSITEIEWHMVGHLQSNKIKYIAPFVGMIHSVDSLKLLNAINKEGKKAKRTINCLLQIHIAKESNKFGFSEDEIKEMIGSGMHESLHNINLCGVMGMATLSDDMKLVEQEFTGLRRLFDQLKTDYFSDDVNFHEVSMGMSGDYKIALNSGSTMVRIGSAIFGHRL